MDNLMKEYLAPFHPTNSSFNLKRRKASLELYILFAKRRITSIKKDKVLSKKQQDFLITINKEQIIQLKKQIEELEKENE